MQATTAQSSRIDAALLGIGLGLWAAGMSMLVWAAWTLGGYMDVDGVAEDHQLVTLDDAYRAYRERTGRFLPRLRQIQGRG